MDGTLKSKLIGRNTAERRALDAAAERERAEAFWRAELSGLGDRIARAIITDAHSRIDDGAAPELAQAAAWFADVARRVTREALVTLPDHSITGGPEPAPGRHRITG